MPDSPPSLVRDFTTVLLRCFSADLKLLLAASAIVLAAWSFVTPVFEAPDEPAHWAYARYIHDHWRLPPYNSEYVEGNQPPLYYLLVAPLAAKTDSPVPLAWIDRRGALQLLCPPRIYKDCPSDFRKYWPVRRARLITAILSLVTVLFTYLSAYEASGSRYTAFTAGALVAFLPGFTFRGTNISNDGLVATSSAIATYLLIRLLATGFTWRRASLAVVFFAIAFLSKISAVIFLPLLISALLFCSPDWRTAARRLSILLLAGALLAPWLIRNRLLYGDPLASKAMLRVVPMLVDKKTILSPYFAKVFPEVLAKSFVGVFGGMTLYLPEWLYRICAAIAIIGLIGFSYAVAVGVIKKRIALLLICLPVLAIASIVQLNLTFTQPQGRYLFPALTAFMSLLAMGLTAIPRIGERAGAYIIIPVCIAINLYALLCVELPAYWTSRGGPMQTVLDTDVSSTAVSSIPVGPLPPGGQFGQSFVSHGPNLSSVEVKVGTYGKTIPTGSIALHLRRNLQDARDIASVVIPAANIADNSFVSLQFSPLADSQGQAYYLFLDAQSIPAQFPVTVYASRNDVYPEGRFFSNKEPTGSDLFFRTLDATGGKTCASCQK